MIKLLMPMLAAAGALVVFPVHAAQYADRVIAYHPGLRSASTASFTNAAAALGEPSRITPGQFGGPVDPFNPPYLNAQLVSLGTNGSLTVEFNPPIARNSSHPYGLDFIIFGHAGFIITNGDYSGGGVTDGTLFGSQQSSTRVSVSADNVSFYALNPELAPGVDGLFPTDGSGDFSQPMNPGLTNANFGGKDMAGIRARYGGSGGGAGYSLDWAIDSQGQSVPLSAIRYVRIEVLSGQVEIDGFAAVSPTIAIFEDFSQNPLMTGWQTFGNSGLFAWNPTNQNLEVTWDSRQPNSYYYHPLNWMLNESTDFGLQFDVQINDITAGVSPGKLFAFEVAVGFLNRAQATALQFERGTAMNSPNLVEFDYFPDTGFGATVSPVIVATNGQFYPSFTFPLELTPGRLYHVAMQFSAANRTLNTVLTSNGLPTISIAPVILSTNFTDFRVDAVAISSYSDQGADGSILAHGTIDNMVVILPASPITQLTGVWTQGTWQLTFQGLANWSYVLERTLDFQSWSSVGTNTASTTGQLQLVDTNPPSARAFYRVTAQR